jgi:hypothetical protein
MKNILFRDAAMTRAGDSAECDGCKRNLRSAELLPPSPIKAELRGHKHLGTDEDLHKISKSLGCTGGSFLIGS